MLDVVVDVDVGVNVVGGGRTQSAMGIARPLEPDVRPRPRPRQMLCQIALLPWV